MRLKVRNIWKEGKGVGKGSFKFRMVAYPTASLLIAVHHIENNLPFTFLEYTSIVVFLITPHVFLYRYVKSHNSIARVIHDSTYDFFFAGWFMGMMNLSVIPSFVFGLGAITNYLAIRGFHKLYRIVLIPIGCLPVLVIENFQWHFSNSNLIVFLSLTYCVVHYIINSYILYFAAYRVRMQNIEIEKQRKEILVQAEKLKVLNDSLQNVNVGLEGKVQDRTRELEIKNKKLEEYTFINAHKLRAPVATILGLIQLLDYKDMIESEIVLAALKKTSIELDMAIKGIRAKLEQEENWTTGQPGEKEKST